jgi:hypothetical protein
VAPVEVRRLAPGDEEEVVRFEAAFDHPVDEAMTRTFLGDPLHHLFVAYVDGMPAGFVSATHLIEALKDLMFEYEL